MFKLSRSHLLFNSLFCSFCLSAAAQAAVVPEGVKLAPVQELKIDATEPETLDPQKMTGSPEGTLANQIFEGLVTNAPNGKIVPAVATHWEHSDDFKSWTFYLRPEAKWSNGEKVTAHDFVYAWQRLADPMTASGYADYLTSMRLENAQEVINGKKPLEALGVKALDDHRLQLTLTDPVPYMDQLVVHYILYPAHRKTIETYGDKWTLPENIVHNGPYRIAEHVINEKIVLKRNPAYWDNEHSVLDQITLYMLQENASLNRFRANELDWAIIPPAHFEKIKKEYADQLFINKKLSNVAYEMNFDRKPFDDVRVRKALDLAIDRQLFVDKVTRRGETPTYTFTPKQVVGGEQIKDPEYAGWTQQQRNEEAKRLLKEAGYSKKNPVKFAILGTKSDTLNNMNVALSAMWKQNLEGMVAPTMQYQEWKTYLESSNQHKFDMRFAAWSADYDEATTFLNYWLSGSPFNRVGMKNQEYDDLLASAYRAATKEERQAIYAKAEAVLDASHPFISLYNPVGVFVKKPYVKGYEGRDPQSRYRFKDFYIEQH